MAISLNDRELEALQGLPMMQVCLYVMGIRPRMDFATGSVGIKRRISWQALSEALYIEPHPGIKSGSPDKSAIRRAAEGLERAGLIRNLSQRRKDDRQLIFDCVLANTDKNTPKKADTKPTHQADTLEPAPVLASEPSADTPKKAKADKHPASDSLLDTSPHIQPNQMGGAGVEFADNIPNPQRPAIEGYLLAVKTKGQRQIMLDDLIGYISQQRAKGTPVKNPAGIMRRMVERWKAGEYQPELAHIGEQIRTHSARQQAQAKAAAEAKAAAATKPRSKPPVKLTDFLKGKGKIEASSAT